MCAPVIINEAFYNYLQWDWFSPFFLHCRCTLKNKGASKGSSSDDIEEPFFRDACVAVDVANGSHGYVHRQSLYLN